MASCESYDVVALEPEDGSKQLHVVRTIFNDQDPCHAHSGSNRVPYQYTFCRPPATWRLGAGLSHVRPSSLAVIGLGAIGGSLAWQAPPSGGRRGRGFSPSRAEGIEALKASAITDLAE